MSRTATSISHGCDEGRKGCKSCRALGEVVSGWAGDVPQAQSTNPAQLGCAHTLVGACNTDEHSMQPSKLACDPLWQCLCPSWSAAVISRPTRKVSRVRATVQCLNAPQRRPYAAQTFQHRPSGSNQRRLEAASRHWDSGFNPLNNEAAKPYKEKFQWKQKAEQQTEEQVGPADFDAETTRSLHDRLHVAAANGKHDETRQIVEYLVKERRGRPSLELYTPLVLANVSHDEGAAWRVHDLLAEMQQAGLQPDGGVCHAVLKVLSVHPDHLLRTDMLAYMQSKWISLTEGGLHDVTAGLLREGAFEQALERLDTMGRDGIRVEPWLLDMFVYLLSEGGEIDEALSILRTRHHSGELNMSKTLWHYFLDRASAEYNMEATSFVWKTQVNTSYLNPNSGTALNVLTTASRAGDAALATDVFTHLSKRGEVFQALHYQLLLDAYLSTKPPDLKRALSILTIMPMENLQPTPWQTRSLYTYLRNDPGLTQQALTHLRDLHTQNRTIPIAALNFLLECLVHQQDLPEALKLYKQIHTFAPITSAPAPSFANIETFNLLLRACRTASPPDENGASFLVSELLALRVQPTSLTYDRLILVFLAAADHHKSVSLSVTSSDTAITHASKSKELIDWAYRHFLDMQPLKWMPRAGTVDKLTIELARAGDERCWDVLQMAEDVGEEGIEGWQGKARWARLNAEEAWAKSQGAECAEGERKCEREVEQEKQQAVA